MRAKNVHFACPEQLVERIDRIAQEEMVSRADVIRRAILWEARACDQAGDAQEPAE